MSLKCMLVFALSILSFAAAVFALITPSPPKDTSAIFQVGNLTCGVCVEKIQVAVRDLDSNAEVQVNLATGLARVTYDKSKTDVAAIAGQITKAGFPATVFNATPKAASTTSSDGVPCPAIISVKKSECGGNCCG